MLKTSKLYVNYNISQFELSKLIILNRFFSRVKLTATGRLIIDTLAVFYNHTKEEMYPSLETLAECSGAGLSTVKTALNELLKEGLILKVASKSVNKYKFTQKFFDLVVLIDDLTPKSLTERLKGFQKEKTETSQPEPESDSQQPEISSCIYNKIDNKKNNKSDFKNIFSNKNNQDKRQKWRNNMDNSQQGINYLSSQDTQDLLNSYKKDKETAGSPLEMPKDEAIAWYEKSHEIIKKGFFGRRIAKKYNLE